MALALLRRKLDKLKEILLSYKPEGNGAASASRSHKPEGNGAASASRSHKPEGNGAASASRSHSQSHKRVLVAYSGGVDSSFLLKCCSDFLGNNNVMAVTAVSPTYTHGELKIAKEIAHGLAVTHKIITTLEFDNPDFKANPQNRCYYCKNELFGKLQSIARKEHINFVLDGSNYDDLKDYRPGAKAKKESGVRSPLAEAGLSKKEIRRLSKEFGLKTWDAPQMACLASRFAYGQEITIDDLKRVEKAEECIHGLGIKMVRVRHYRLPDRTLLARIEVNKEDIKKVTGYRLQVTGCLKKLGYNYVTLDLEGYRTGSMNAGLYRDGSLVR